MDIIANLKHIKQSHKNAEDALAEFDKWWKPESTSPGREGYRNHLISLYNPKSVMSESESDVCYICGAPGFKTNGESKTICRKHAGLEMGRTAPIRNEPKVGRNEPCPCGSGKKYKKCCIEETHPLA